MTTNIWFLIWSVCFIGVTLSQVFIMKISFIDAIAAGLVCSVCLTIMISCLISNF